MKKPSLNVSQQTLVKATVPPGGEENIQSMLCSVMQHDCVFIVDSADE